MQKTTRQPADVYLSQPVFDRAIGNASSQRELELLEWLHDPHADSATLIDWIRGDGLVVLRNESPSQAIRRMLASLESGSTECTQMSIRGVFVQRLAETIDWLATDRASRAELSHGGWVELLDLANHLSYSEWMSTSVSKLRRAIEQDAVPPFSLEHDVAYQLTRLIRSNQPDNELESRWMNLIQRKPDPLLRAGPLDAMNGLLSMPAKIDYDTFEEAVGHLCARIDATPIARDDKQRKLKELSKMIESEASTYRLHMELAIAALSTQYDWFPTQDGIIVEIAQSDDMAKVSHAARSTDVNLASIAEVRYRYLSKKSRMPAAFELFLSERLGNHRRGKATKIEVDLVPPKRLNRFGAKAADRTTGGGLMDEQVDPASMQRYLRCNRQNALTG